VLEVFDVGIERACHVTGGNLLIRLVTVNLSKNL